MVMFDNLLLYAKEGIAAVGVLVIIGGAIRAAYQLVVRVITPQIYDVNTIRLHLGSAVILGLEFLVGADIVGSVMQPDYYNLGLIAILVLVRTVLSYFLNRELETLKA